MVLACNNPDGAREALEELRDDHDPVAQSRMARLHGRPMPGIRQLTHNRRWQKATELAARLTADTTLDLNLDEPI